MKSINFQDDSQLWDVVILDDAGNWQTLLPAVCYDRADFEVDRYTDLHPHAIVDVIKHVSKAIPETLPF